jgi:vitamin B12 transporter
MSGKRRFVAGCVSVFALFSHTVAQDSTGAFRQQSPLPEEPLSAATAIGSGSCAPEKDSTAAIIVTATRRPQISRWISDDHTVLQVEREARTTSKSASEMLADRVPAFMSDYGGGGAAKKISLRGAGSERTLVLIDGKRVGTNDNDLSDLAVEAVKKIEVVEGGQSALYGMDAVGGVVNMITRRPAGDGTSGSFSSTVSSYEPNNGRTADVNTGGNQAMISNRTGPMEGLLAGDWTFGDGRYDYAAAGDRYQVRGDNAFRNLNGFGRFGYSADSLTLGVTGSAGDRIIQNPGSVAWPSPGTTRKKIVSACIDGAWKPSDYFTSRVSGSFGRDRIGFTARDLSMAQNSSHLHFTGNVELVEEFTVRKQLITTGVEYRRESMLSSDIGTRLTGQTGVFAGAVGTVSSDLIMLQTTPTVRLDYINSGSGIVNGKIGAIGAVKVKGEPTFFVNIGTASRTPALNDLYWPRDPYGVGNPLLKPERSASTDAGFQLRTVSGPATATARVTAYTMQMREMIIWQPDPADTTGMRWTPVNKAKALIRGIHGDAELLFGKIFSSTFGAAWNDARDEQTKNRLIYRPEYAVTYTQGVAFDRINAGLTCRYLSSVFTNDQNTTALPECTVFDGRVGADLFSSLDGKRSIGLVYEMLNCTNARHYTNDGYPLPGREHRLSLKMVF